MRIYLSTREVRIHLNVVGIWPMLLSEDEYILLRAAFLVLRVYANIVRLKYLYQATGPLSH